MGKLAGTGTVSGAIGGAAAVLAIAIFARTGTALEPQRAAAGTPVSNAPSPQTTRAAAPPAARPAAMVDYEREIRPILSENCLECHSQDKRKGGLSLATYGDVLDGGKDGAVVRPGRSSHSMMIDRVKGTVGDRMPLDELPLSDEQIALLQRWIDQGARATPTSAPAPPPWEAPLALTAPALPAVVWPGWNRPADRLVAAYLSRARVAQPTLVPDAAFARRAYLDVWGLLPSAADLRAFVADTAPDKRDRLVARLLADDKKYAEHWISFWNDLLRNEDGQSYFSEQSGRRSITEWLMSSLVANRPYDEFVAKLLNPSQPGDPEGFLIGVNWRGETSAAVMPWMQASQNTAQAFLGVNFKCNACHDSFVSKWKLKDAYGLAAYFSPEPKLQLYRCDIARDEYAEPSFFYPDIGRPVPSPSLNDRRATAAAIFTDPRNGRMPRTAVNRIWTRLLGHGIVPNSDEMDGKPWSPALLDWLASDFVAHKYDVKHLIATIMASRAYQMPAVARKGEAPARNYAFRGPELRRLTAEQFADAIGTITGEWSTSTAPPLNVTRPGTTSQAAPAPPPARPPGPRRDSDSPRAGYYVREYRNSSSLLTRALGRPIRDQVTSVRATEATTLQSLELVNGEILTSWLMRGARRMTGQLADDPLSVFNASVGGRNVQARMFEADVSAASKLWLIISDTGSNAPERVLPVLVNAEFAGPAGTVPLSSLTPVDASGLRAAQGSDAARVPLKNSSRLVYDISGRGFTQFRGSVDVDNSRAEVGSTLNPQLRFFIFAAEPNMRRLLSPFPGVPLPGPATVSSPRDVVDHVFWSALGRAPSAAERQVAEAAIANAAAPGQVAPDAVADFLWAILMKPEFQLIY
jgi:mono/diheme cytochrome c family protein